MPKYLVLLRGVNVGKANRVPMAEFKLGLEALGYSQAQTLLNSGNAVFSSAIRSPAKLAEDIVAMVKARCGVDAPVIVKSAVEFEQIVAGNPFVPPEVEHSKFLVAFAMDSARLLALEHLQILLQPGEQFALTRHAAYLHCPGGLLQSRAGEALLGKTGRGVTTRNWATVLKLRVLLAKG